ncbi:MAG TPA: FtsX-like permease family protein [Vicinamibacterales bacterium]|nr:FtsX-like permease family protein [Vicinamibacterales bacterium]
MTSHLPPAAAGASFDILRQDVRQAGRALRHSRGFALWVVGSLAIGMAVAIAALAFLNALLFRPFPAVTGQDRLVRVAVSRDCGRPDCRERMSSAADHASLQEGLTGLQGLAAYALGNFAVALPEARSMRGALTSANYFDVLGLRPAVGRTFEARDAETHAAVGVISHRVWTREFGADPAVIGRSIRVAGEFVEIVGVAPAYFAGIDLKPARGDRGVEVWLPIWLADRVLPLTRAEQRRQERELYFAGRLKDGLEVPHIQAEAEVVALRLAGLRGQTFQAVRADVQPVLMGNPAHRKFAVIVVLPIPILVLVIACVNAANLMSAHGSQRQREIAIRLALGAGRGRIISQLLIESAVLSLLAAAVALPLAWLGLQLAHTPLGTPIAIDATVLALTVITATVTTVAFGLAPALRISAQQPSSTLGAARSDAVPRQSRMRRALVVVQVALSLGLMATAWQLVATVRLQAVSGGTAADRLLIARFDLQPLGVSAAEAERFYHTVVDGVRRLRGVEAAGVARHTSVWSFGQGAAPGSIRVWHPTDRPDDERVTMGGYAGGDLFEALGVRTLHGRGFTDADRQPPPQVAVVNQTFAESLAGPAVGSIVQVAPRNQDFRSSIAVRIVGIIEPTVEPRYTPGERPAQQVYLPSPIEPEPALALYVRTRSAAATVAQPLRELVGRIAPRVPILELGSLDELNERSFGPQLWLARAAVCLGVIGLLLATAGLYGVSSYVVAMRSREIAIRMALGAMPRTILAMILGQSMRVAVIGLLTGGGAAAAVSRVIQAEYHGIQGLDRLAFGGSAALFLAAMLLASAFPAIRASRVDPLQNLKEG